MSLELLTGRWVVATAESLWQGVVLTVVVALLLRMLRIRHSGTRYALWWATLVVLALLPALGHTGARRETATTNAAPFESPMAGSLTLPSPAERPAEPPVLSKPRPKSSLEIREGRWSVWVASAWLLGVLILGVRLLWSVAFVLRLKRRSAAVTGVSWLPADIGPRRLRVATSDAIGVPMAVGWLRPLILVPEPLVRALSDGELSQVVLHEEAHLRRWDDWTNVAQKVVEALFYFHPAVRFIARELDREREMACDDYVLASTGDAKPYARCLTRLMDMIGRGASSMVAPGAFRGPSDFTRRIEMLLNGKRSVPPRFARAAVVAVTLAGVALALGTIEILTFVVAPPVVEAQARTPEPESAARKEIEKERARQAMELAAFEKERRAFEERMAEASRLPEIVGVGQAPEPPKLLKPFLALGHRGEPAISEKELLTLMLEVAKNDQSPDVRAAALNEISSMEGEEGATALAALYDETRDEDAKDSILGTLARNRTKPAIEKLKAVARSDPEPDRRLLAVRLLGGLSRSPGRLLAWPGPLITPPTPPAAPTAPRPPKARPDEEKR